MSPTTTKPHPLTSLSRSGPYATLDKDSRMRVNNDISLDDHQAIANVCPLHGTFSFIGATLFHHIANELRKRNITTYNPDALLTILYECTNCSSNPRTDGATTSAPNDIGGTSSVCPAPPGTSDIPSDVDSAAKRRKRRA